MTSELNRLNSEYSFTAVICGNGKGAERVGLEWAEARGIQVIEFKPAKNMVWRESTYARNERMLTIGQPDLCVAFGGAYATDELIAQVEKRGIKVIRIDIE